MKYLSIKLVAAWRGENVTVGHVACFPLEIYRRSYIPGTTVKTKETAVAQWLRCCATNRKVVGSIPDGVIGIFH